MSKQTIWLITMLSLMVVLSAYYIVSGPVEPADNDVASADDVSVDTKETNPLELALFGSDGEKDGGKDEKKEEAETSAKDEDDEKGKEKEKKEDAPTFGSEDYFMVMQAERSSINEQLLDKYTGIMTDPKSTDEQAEEASAKVKELQSTIEQITQLEELIRGEGYEDALVRHDEGRYDITVQADKLSKKEAVKILQSVQDETELPPTSFTISYHP